MGRPGPATQAKKQRERSKQERKQEKIAKRNERKEMKKDHVTIDGIDPDLIGIRPGPQPRVED